MMSYKMFIIHGGKKMLIFAIKQLLTQKVISTFLNIYIMESYLPRDIGDTI